MIEAEQVAIAVAQVTFMFFGTVVLLTQANMCIAWHPSFPVWRKVAYIPGTVFFLTLVTTTFLFVTSPLLPNIWLGMVAMLASIGLMAFHVGSLIYFGFILR